jgi:hypothetical protein
MSDNSWAKRMEDLVAEFHCPEMRLHYGVERQLDQGDWMEGLGTSFSVMFALVFQIENYAGVGAKGTTSSRFC